jgi:serine/threonine-protein kinase
MPNAALALEGAGLVLDRYRPLRPLGSGGSGSVWLARDEQTGLDVALKIVAREGKAAMRAEREAAAAARLRHPSCLRAYAFARDARHVYIAYEFVPGRTFREALRAGELNDGTAIEACAQICDGLAHAHATGILHRDVKPSNVLFDAAKSSALADFGLAKGRDYTALTRHGEFLGTPHYVAPELIVGEPASGASDIYALGCVLYEAATGAPPFAGRSALEVGLGHLEEAPPDPRERAPELSEGVAEALELALAKDPGERPTTGHALAWMLKVSSATRP